MGSTAKGIIAVLLTGGIVYLVYKKFYKGGGAKSDAQTVIDALEADFGKKPEHMTFVKGADAPYISAWASAIRSKSSTFFYNGKTYNTKGGATVK